MKKIVIRTVKSLAFVALIFLLCSCTKTTLETEENPIVLSSDAQIKVTHIKNLLAISSNDFSDSDDPNDLDNAWTSVENEWIYCHFKRSKNVTQDLNIEVKENTYIENRTLKLVVRSKMYEDTLIITQLGKTK